MQTLPLIRQANSIFTPPSYTSKMQLSSNGARLRRSAKDEPLEESSTGKVAAQERLGIVLLESRERWRELATLASDVAFEVNSSGKICFIYPTDALGYSEGQLLGARASSLLGQPADTNSFDPFRPTKWEAGRTAWLRDVRGTPRCHIFSVRPLLDACGNDAGVRGVARNVDNQNQYDTAVAASLRRAELLDHILWRMRRETKSAHMMQAILEALMNAVGACGVILIDPSGEYRNDPLIHAVGTTPTKIVTAIMQAAKECDRPGGSSSETHSFLFHPIRTLRSGKVIIALWHHNHPGLWGTEEQVLTASVSAVISIVMEHATVQRELNQQALTDPLTNLLNRRAFFEEVERRITRSDHDLTSNVVLFIDLDNFKWINDTRGHEMGDECLRQFSVLLRSVFRPTDLVARIGGDEFSVWMDGADEFAASERANHFEDAAAEFFSQFEKKRKRGLGASIGRACKIPRSGESIDSLMRRADSAMYAAKRTRSGTRFGRPQDDERYER